MDKHQRDWTTKELADRYGLDQSYFRHKIRNKEIVGVKRGGAWFISHSEVERWLLTWKGK